MFICWRVKQGTFTDNVFSDNARNGISIGHKDTDNLLERNTVRSNGQDGILFRDELPAMAANRNRLLGNTIEDNGAAGEAAGVRIRGATSGNEIRGNVIRESRGAAGRQTIGVILEAAVGENVVVDNDISAAEPVRDDRQRGGE
jgi:parallel beta-helix repeat protein